MKKIFNYKLLLVYTAVLLSSISCTKDFDEINKNNNAATSEQAAPEMLLTNCIEALTDRVHEIFLGEEMGSCWVQHQAKVQYTDEDRYRPRLSVINNTWASFYASSGMDAEAIIKIAKQRGADYDNYQAIGTILKCYVMSVVTDLYGDVPYSEAFKARPADGSILNPVYDKQSDIYADLILKLKEANAMLSSTNPAITGDILFGNDITKWKKFANSLRLRLLLRQSDKVDPTAEMTDMLVTNAADYPIFESNADNAALIYLGSAPNNNPVEENRKTRDDHRVSQTLIDIMYTTNSNVDWRVTVYANLAVKSGDFVGMPNGLESADANAYLGNGIDQTSKLGSYFTTATAPGMLMSYAELQFILAESVQRGFVTGSAITAEQYYLEGIAGSYKQYSAQIVANTVKIFGKPAATTTIASLTADYISYDGKWVVGKELERISTERWLATFDQGLQSWFDWRRTGYPVLTPVVDGYNPTIPQRVSYPSDEYSRNKTNVLFSVSRQGVDDLNTRVWWDVANNF